MPERKLSAVRSQWASKGIEAEILPIALSQFLNRLAGESGNGAVQTVKGELRDNAAALRRARAYMLQGVLSSRLYLKRENRRAEHRLIALMEPLLTILNIERRLNYPEWELRHAWKHLLQNHPHDSICGCSVDAVHDEMMTRYAGMHQLLDAIETKMRSR
jgi:alpha-mannosidase